jgi:hypothetical protein
MTPTISDMRIVGYRWRRSDGTEVMLDPAEVYAVIVGTPIEGNVEDAPDGLQRDLASVIARIEQASNEPEMADFLLHRLATCDVPRLRRYLTAETVTLMASSP